jgi:hypothetical protein
VQSDFALRKEILRPYGVDTHQPFKQEPRDARNHPALRVVRSIEDFWLTVVKLPAA